LDGGDKFSLLQAENQKQTFLIVGHRAKPLTDAAFASAATRSGWEAFRSRSHAPPATS